MTSLKLEMKFLSNSVLKRARPGPFKRTWAYSGTSFLWAFWALKLRASIGISMIMEYSLSLTTNTHKRSANPTAPNLIPNDCQLR